MPSRRDESQQKHARVVEYMQAHGLDVVILTRRCNFAWYTAGGLNHVSTAADGGASSLVITAEGTVCITSTIEAPRVADEELAGLGIDLQACVWYDGADAARGFAAAIGRRPAACDAPVPGLPEGVARLGPDFDTLRWTMTEGEIERYRTLGREVAEGLESACREARPGVTEHELGSRVAALLLEKGIRTPVLLMAADGRIQQYRHPIPTARKFTRYGMAVAGGERHGLIVSNTRLFSFGPIDADLRHRHEAVCRVDAAMIAATRPGKTLGDVFAAGQQAYADAGLPNEWTCHHQGGLTGYVGREIKATPGNTTPIQTHQVFAWNPSIAGTKSEDTILVGPETNEILSATGRWPTIDYDAGGRTWHRCGILEL